jgi:hypothetical protein
MRFVLKKSEFNEDPKVRLFLKKDENGGVDLMVQRQGGSSFFALTFKKNGTIVRPECIPEDIGLNVDKKGRLDIE